MMIWFYSLVSGVIVLPWQNVDISHPHAFDQKRLFQLAITCFALVLVAVCKQHNSTPKQKLLVLLLILTALPSIALAEHSLLAATEWANMAGLFCGALLVSHIPNIAQKVFLVAVAACSAYALLVTMHLLNRALLGIGDDVVLLLPGFSNIRFFNHWQTWTLPIVGALPIFHSRISTVPRYWLWALAIIWWALLYISAGRGSTLSIAAASFFIYFWVGKPSLPLLKTLGLCTLSGFTLGAAYVTLMTHMGVSGEHVDGGLVATTASDRLIIWQKTWQLWLEHWAFGVGGLHYPQQANTILGSPHNIILLTLSEHGVLAGGLLLGTLALALITLCRSLKQTNSPILLAYGIAIMAAAIHSLFSGVQLAPYSQLWLMLIIGAYWGSTRALKAQETQSVITKGGGTVRAIAAISACLLIAGVAYTIIDPSLPDPWSLGTHTYQPRLWVDGRF